MASDKNNRISSTSGKSSFSVFEYGEEFAKIDELIASIGAMADANLKALGDLVKSCATLSVETVENVKREERTRTESYKITTGDISFTLNSNENSAKKEAEKQPSISPTKTPNNNGVKQESVTAYRVNKPGFKSNFDLPNAPGLKPCKRCGKQIFANARFCTNCGSKQ